MSEIIIVPEIYNEWPEEISDCWISVSNDVIRNKYVSKIIRNNDNIPKNVYNFLDFVPIGDEVGKVEWYVENNNAYIIFAELDNSLVGHKIGKWFFILLRTHIAKYWGHKIVPPKNGTIDYINQTLVEIAKEYNEGTLEIRTEKGEIKPFSEVQDNEMK